MIYRVFAQLLPVELVGRKSIWEEQFFRANLRPVGTIEAEDSTQALALAKKLTRAPVIDQAAQ